VCGRLVGCANQIGEHNVKISIQGCVNDPGRRFALSEASKECMRIAINPLHLT